MANILALDLSTNRTGYAIREDNEIKYGTISAGSKNVLNRIFRMRDSVIDLIKEHNITEIVIEEVPTMPNLHTYKVLVWLQAAVVFAINEYDEKMPITYILPSEWRAALRIKQGFGIRRDKLKKESISYISEKMSVEIKDEDICDALCLLYAYEKGVNQSLDWSNK